MKDHLAMKANLKLKIVLLREIQLPQHPFTEKEDFLKIRSLATKGHPTTKDHLTLKDANAVEASD
jgi:hypothetical protein